jgi:hypothetical protein
MASKGVQAMARDESEFQKLLSEAPAAPDADTVTAVGLLARTADSARFMLTLPNGRSETLEVGAVKSAKKVAGAIGQSLVELELDAKRVPEALRSVLSGLNSYYPAVGGVGVGTTAHKDIYETISPFVAASPHQAHPAAMAALSLFGGTRTYISYNDWTSDHHTVYKAHTDPQ